MSDSTTSEAEGQDDFNTFCDTIFGDREGYVWCCFGIAPHLSASGAYEHSEFRQAAFSWPQERDKLWQATAEATAVDPQADLYITPQMFFGTTAGRKKQAVLLPRWLFVDLDGPCRDPELLSVLNPFVVHSGQNRHLYVALEEPIDVAAAEGLGKALADRLGGDTKWSLESLGRLPGSLNLKAKVVHGGQPVLVTVEDSDFTVGTLEELKQRLGIVGEVLQPAGITAEAITPEPLPEGFEPSSLLLKLRDYYNQSGRDRSAGMYALVGQLKFHWLTPGQCLTWIMEYFRPAVDKYGCRLPAEVARSFAKAEEPPPRDANRASKVHRCP